MKVQPPMNAFFKKSENSAKGSSENQSSSNAASCSNKQQQSLDKFVTQDEVTRAELLWAMNVSYKHFSYRSCSDVVSLFQSMFTDSNIASQVTLGKTKVAYYITHGLAPYFHNELKNSISQCRYLVACFDESLNDVVQKGQMDICLRFWDIKATKVTTRYYSSTFLGHATASNLFDSFADTSGGSLLLKVLQVFMDGPSVNWKFFNMLSTALDEKFDTSLLEIGCCGLHVVHGAFLTGHKAVRWNMNSVLRSFYKLFHNSPA